MDFATQNLIISLCEGNPGAVRVCADLWKQAGNEPLEKLKAKGIRSHKIWELFKDQCGEDLGIMIEALG
jgi:hypothetical protein